MWEDKANKAGGRWMITLVKKRSDLDRYWIDTVLCLIGEAFDSFDEICGAVVNIRPKGDKIGKWKFAYFRILLVIVHFLQLFGQVIVLIRTQ